MNLARITYLTDAKGRRKAVQIPYADWQALQEELEAVRQAEKMKATLTEAFAEIREVEAGRLPGKRLSEFLDELDAEAAGDAR